MFAHIRNKMSLFRTKGVVWLTATASHATAVRRSHFFTAQNSPQTVTPKNYVTATTHRTLGVVIRGWNPNSLVKNAWERIDVWWCGAVPKK